MWWEWEGGGDDAPREETPVDFDFISLPAKPKDYYKILEVDYNASEEMIRSSYIRLALKWHPDKKQGEENSTSKFQEINEAYQGRKRVLVVGSTNVHLNDLTNKGYNATTIDSMTLDKQGKVRVTLCQWETCNRKDCYCCLTSKIKKLCYDTRDKCLANCPACSPKCPPNHLLN